MIHIIFFGWIFYTLNAPFWVWLVFAFDATWHLIGFLGFLFKNTDEYDEEYYDIGEIDEKETLS